MEYRRKENRFERKDDAKKKKKRVVTYNKNGIRLFGERSPKQRFFPGE